VRVHAPALRFIVEGWSHEPKGAPREKPDEGVAVELSNACIRIEEQHMWPCRYLSTYVTRAAEADVFVELDQPHALYRCGRHIDRAVAGVVVDYDDLGVR